MICDGCTAGFHHCIGRVSECDCNCKVRKNTNVLSEIDEQVLEIIKTLRERQLRLNICYGNDEIFISTIFDPDKQIMKELYPKLAFKSFFSGIDCMQIRL